MLLGCCFHTFSHDLEPQVVGQTNGGGTDGGIVAVVFQVLYKCAVQLQVVQRQRLR